MEPNDSTNTTTTAGASAPPALTAEQLSAMQREERADQINGHIAMARELGGLTAEQIAEFATDKRVKLAAENEGSATAFISALQNLAEDNRQEKKEKERARLDLIAGGITEVPDDWQRLTLAVRPARLIELASGACVPGVDYGAEREYQKQQREKVSRQRAEFGNPHLPTERSAFIPFAQLARHSLLKRGEYERARALFTNDPSTVGGLTTQDRLPQYISESLREGSCLAQLPITHIPVNNPSKIPLVNRTTKAYWRRGTETSATTASSITVGQQTFVYRVIVGKMPFGRQIINTTEPAATMIGLDEMSEAFDETLCYGVLRNNPSGSGADDQAQGPTGVTSRTGVNSFAVAAADGAGDSKILTPSWDEMVGMVQTVKRALKRPARVNSQSFVFVTDSLVAGKLATTTRAGGTSAETFIAMPDGDAWQVCMKRLIEYEGLGTSNLIIGGVWSEAFIAWFNDAVELRTDYDTQDNGGVVYRFFIDCDTAIRRPQAFVVARNS